MDWTLILAGAALVAALAALGYAWLGFWVLTDAAIRHEKHLRALAGGVVDVAEAAAKMREVDVTLSDHLQWHVAKQMTNSISLLRDIEETNDEDRERC